jgi:PP-loop superfamily ATP-utilizing enzyme
MVRIELDPDGVAALGQPGVRESIVEVCKAEGFRWVTVDLQGYQRGALSTALSGSATGSSA